MGKSTLEDKMEAARRLGHVLAKDSGGVVDSVYIAGSLTAGLGNLTSDADLFILLNPGAPTDDGAGQYTADGHRVDVERFPLSDVAAMIDEVIGFKLRRDNLTALHKLPAKLDFSFRMLMAEEVVCSDALTRFRRQLNDAMPAVRRTAINYFSAALNGHLEDFLGATAEGDLDTAAFAGQALVGYAGKAVAAAADDLYFSSKWVYKQLARTAVGEFPLESFRFYQSGAWTALGLDGADSLALFTQTCVAVSQLLAEVGVPVSAWPSWQQGEPGEHGAGLWRNPMFNVFRVEEGFLLHWELNRQVVLKESAACVWALCDGRSADEIAAAISFLARHVPALQGITRHRVATILDALQKRGLVGTARFSLVDAIQPGRAR
jgi:hypothetical protein